MATIAVDLMGGDHAPEAIALGCFQAARDLGVDIKLVGQKDALAREIERRGGRNGRVFAVEAEQVVGMSEAPTAAWRDKKGSSISVGLDLVRTGEAQAFVSAGNTGAIATYSLFSLGMMRGIERPAIATLYTSLEGHVSMMLDIGANVECRPPFLAQFGRVGSDFMAKVFQVPAPRVALVSNGEEATKGTKLVRDAHQLLKESGLNFIGNAEGFDLPKGTADVYVMDGFTGNVVLKLAEGLAESIFKSIKESLRKSLGARLSAALWAPALRNTLAQWGLQPHRGRAATGRSGQRRHGSRAQRRRRHPERRGPRLPHGAGRLGGRARAVGVPTGPGTSQLLIDAYGIMG